jgi:hypothetical protein
VDQDISIGMRLQAAIMGDLDPAEHQAPPYLEPVGIIALAYAHAFSSCHRK